MTRALGWLSATSLLSLLALCGCFYDGDGGDATDAGADGAADTDSDTDTQMA